MISFQQTPRIAVAAAAILCGALAFAFPASAKMQQVPASRITLDVPDGYSVSKQFPGFINETTGASVIAVEMPAAAFADFKKDDFAAKLAANGFANVKAATLPFKGEHIYVTAEQATAAGAFAKFLLIFHDATTTAMLTVNVLKADVTSGKLKASDVEAMLQTAALASAKAEAQVLPFTLGYLGPFKAAGTMGHAQLYTRDGKAAPDTPDPGRALFVVAPSIDKTEIKDVALTSKVALAAIFDIDAGTVVREGAVTVDGIAGYEIEIEAPQKRASATVPGVKSAAYQIILPGKGGGYVRMLGTGTATEAAQLIPEFRKMAASFKAAPPQ